jgi:hypothetical protein
MSMAKTRLSSLAQLMGSRQSLGMLDLALCRGGLGSLLLRLGPLAHHQCLQLGVRGQHPVKPNQVQPRAWHQPGQRPQEPS